MHGQSLSPPSVPAQRPAAGLGNPAHDNCGRSYVKDERYNSHQRNQSLHVNWSEDDVKRIAKELYDGTIADVHLSLFTYWIRETKEHYELAKRHIRELGLDQGYNVERIRNLYLRKLLRDVHQSRPKEPPHATAVRLYTLSMNQKRCSPSAERPTPSPVIGKPQTLLPSLRTDRERDVKETVRSSPLQSAFLSSRMYPPDTPDRPAPLNLKSRSSQPSNAVPKTGNPPRSVSSPTRSIRCDHSVPFSFPRNSVVFQEAASHPLLNPTARIPTNASSGPGTEDVFGIVEKTFARYGDNFRGMHGVSEIVDSIRHRDSREPRHQHIIGSYKPNDTDDASSVTLEVENYADHHRKDEVADYKLDGEKGILIDEALDFTTSYPAFNDEISTLETASLVSDTSNQVRYSYALSAPPPKTGITHPASSPLQGHPLQPRLQSQDSSIRAVATRFHRPLPMRDNESEVHQFDSARVRSASNYSRANATSESCICSSHPASLANTALPFDGAIPIPPRSNSGGSHPGSGAQHTSIASIIDAFPIPPMQSPVGELPMTIIRALSTLEARDSSNSLAEEKRRAHETRINGLLERTRQHGARLPIVDWDSLTLFEREWRELNEQLLTSIYGRINVVLTNQEVEYVVWISKELRSGTSASERVKDILYSGF